MKKIFIFLVVVVICTIAYFNIGPEKKVNSDKETIMTFHNLEQESNTYVENNEVLAYLSLGLGENSYMDESDVQAYTPTDVMKSPGQTRKKTRYYAVTHYKPRASSLGFSITPPPGSNWFEKLENDSLIYVKINKSHKRYAILTEAREVRLNKTISNLKEARLFVKNQKEKSISSTSFKQPNLSVQEAKSFSEKCLRYSQHYQDHGMKGLTGRRYVNVDTQGIFCLHPDNARVAIDINYVEKSLSNTQVRSYSSEGEKFLASLKFL